MYKVSFVILHYMSFEYTNDCIESILKNVDYLDYNIIVVDNNSTNNSYEKLKNKYDKVNKIYFIKNDMNLGFAKGNNVGYKFAKYKLNSDFIILLNNDTIIEQKDFIKVLINKYEETNYYVLGPDIITLDGIHQNPQRNKLITCKEIKKLRIKFKLKLILNYIGLESVMNYIYKTIKTSFQTNLELNKINYEQEQVNVQLHGACLIFSPLYVSKFNGLYEKTFMYMEEDIFLFTLLKEKCKVIYSPSIKIIHKENGVTNFIYYKDFIKRRFYYKNVLKSSKIFLKYIKKYEIERQSIIDNSL